MLLIRKPARSCWMKARRQPGCGHGNLPLRPFRGYPIGLRYAGIVLKYVLHTKGTAVGCACGDGVIDWEAVVAVLKPLKLVIDNYPDGQVEMICPSPIL